ncbi:hypothetical protein [Endozoicomonas sp. SCSIO W0465]|uniref:hypothetical protein n=1 Tax=Endozoicomonas sp. SCSIO W0465 TaxID=2918516 RepID=UPI002075EA48|nr:hypothetical protein [Endozoicomonas sp. SCSIO W0465]USE37025.1 hypothetical protein MJO57_01965 [Endozoicomonas sp. SCSIO W0465]
MAFPGCHYCDSRLTSMNRRAVGIEVPADESASFNTYRCKEVVGKRRVADLTDFWITGDALDSERDCYHRSVRAISSERHLYRDLTDQQNYRGSEYTAPRFNRAHDRLFDISSPRSVSSYAEPMFDSFAETRSHQHFNRYEMPAARADFFGDFSGNNRLFQVEQMSRRKMDPAGNVSGVYRKNRKQKPPRHFTDMHRFNPPVCATRGFSVQEQVNAQRVKELSRYQDLIEEVKPFFPAGTVNRYIQDFLSGKREKLELSGLFKCELSPYWLRATDSAPVPFSYQGKAPGLSQEQKEQLRTILQSQKPSDFGINDGIWNMANVRDLIKDLFQIDYQKSSIRNIIYKMNMTFGSINGRNKSIMGS